MTLMLLRWIPTYSRHYKFFCTDGSLAADRDVFGLNGQIEHKLAFLRKHVPRETNLVLVGHSIGCYIILEMMKRDPELKASHNSFPFLGIHCFQGDNIYQEESNN